MNLYSVSIGRSGYTEQKELKVLANSAAEACIDALRHAKKHLYDTYHVTSMHLHSKVDVHYKSRPK